MSGAEKPRLGATIDGVPLPEPEARALWTRFSAYMESHKGDLGGFALAEGYLSVHPQSDGGRAVLACSRTKAQAAYGSVAKPPREANHTGSKKKRR